MSGAVVESVHVAAAHDGEAELVVSLRYPNGGRSAVALDSYAARHLMAACRAGCADDLVGAGWEPVRDALAAASARFLKPLDPLAGGDTHA
ncbi:hypothetical protein [Thermaurantiacus sp.]